MTESFQQPIVAHVITGLGRGGAENVLYRLISAQPDPSRHVVISLTDEGVFGLRLRALGVPVFCLHMGMFHFPGGLLKLVRLLRRINPSLVQTWMYHSDLLGGVAARMCGIAVVWGLHHSNLTRQHNKWTTRVVARVNATLSAWIPARIISCSQVGVATHLKAGYSDRFVVIPNGQDFSRFFFGSAAQRTAARLALGIPVDAQVIGHLGRPHPQKDHRTLLAAYMRVASANQNAWLLLAGQDLERGSDYLESLLAEFVKSEVRTRIVALGARDDVPDLMNAMDVFLLSSSVGEAFPVVLTEAMSCGVPCVTTDVGDSKEIVGGTGWFSQPGDVEGLANHVLFALSESGEAKSLRRHDARERIVRHYGVARMVEDYQRVWNVAMSTNL